MTDETAPRALTAALAALPERPLQGGRLMAKPEALAQWRQENLARMSLLNDSWPHKVEAFRRFYQRPIEPTPSLLNDADIEVHDRIISEEWKEFWEAVMGGDLIGQLDGALDLIYTVLGYLLHIGIAPAHINACFEEIHAANMTKVDDNGQPVILHGKIQKTPNYTPPNLPEAIRQSPPFTDPLGSYDTPTDPTD